MDTSTVSLELTGGSDELLSAGVAAGGSLSENVAGRISFNHSYRRLVIDALSQHQQDRTYRSLAELMRLDDRTGGVDLRHAVHDYVPALISLRWFWLERTICYACRFEFGPRQRAKLTERFT